MSRIADLGDKKSLEVKERFKNLPAILADYTNELKDAEHDIVIKGKSLEGANRENASLYSYYDQRRVELKTLVDFMDNQVARTRGRLWRTFTENNNRELSDRTKDKYIDGEQAYLDIFEVYLEVKEVYESYASIVEAIKLRGYSLNNITKARVASMENASL